MRNKLIIILRLLVCFVRIIHTLTKSNTTVIRYDLWECMTVIIVEE